jgi:hypothetical protein
MAGVDSSSARRHREIREHPRVTYDIERLPVRTELGESPVWDAARFAR